MSLPSFKWKDLDSYEDFGIVISETPSVPKPKKKVNTYEIDGRDGDITVDTNCYQGFPINLQCTLLDNDEWKEWEDKLDEIKVWLEGSDKLIFSFSENRYYDARISDGYSFEQTIDIRGEFIIPFYCQPFAYDTFNSSVEIIEQGQCFYNPYTYYSSKPTITVFGEGNITIHIKDYFGEEQIVYLKDVVDEITMDSNLEEAHKNNIPCNQKMDGEFFILSKEDNFFTWEGNVSKIEVLGNLRFL